MSLFPEAAGTHEQAAHGALLVVDDDPIVRRMVRCIAELERLTVVEAADGEHALRVIGRDEAHLLDAVLTELELPVVSGSELIAVLQDCRPDLFVAAMSDSAEPPSWGQHIPFLRKPFTPYHLVQVVTPLVDAARTMRQQARQQRADAAESRILAARQGALARGQQARAAELMSALARLRQQLEKPAT
jgi:two-component system, NtrC family, C4-dicarboxylate transport response regulator DctD